MGKVMNKILARLDKENKKTKEDHIFQIHHTLMKEYGWIPLEEFKKLPMQTVNNLLKQINEERIRDNKKMNSGKGVKGIKKPGKGKRGK